MPYNVAIYQKAIIWCILAYFIAVIAQFAIPPEARLFLGLAFIGVAVVATVFVFMLARGLRHGDGYSPGATNPDPLRWLDYLALAVMPVMSPFIGNYSPRAADGTESGLAWSCNSRAARSQSRGLRAAPCDAQPSRPRRVGLG